MPAEGRVLVCMSINAPIMAQGSTLDRKCHACGIAVMLAPSGQQFLRDYPEAQLMCFACWNESTEEFEPGGLAGDRETIRQEMKNAVPNLHRERN